MSNQTQSNPAPVEKHGIPGRPGLSVADAEILASKQYGLIGSATPLPSYSDQNFLFEMESGERFVLKIFNSQEEPAFLEAQQHALLRLEQAGLPVPRVVPTCDEAGRTHLELDASGRHLVQMVTWLDGQVLAKVRPQSTQLLEALGKTLGEMDSALRDFDHPGMYRRLDWDLVHASDTIRTRLRYLASSDQRTLVEEFLALYENEVLPELESLPKQVIHGDANDYNVLVAAPGLHKRDISGVIDFGDMTHSLRISELAISASYAILSTADPLSAGCAVAAGYHSVSPLTKEELEVLFALICVRLCVIVCMAALQKRVEPDNEYLTISEVQAWKLLRKFSEISPRYAVCRFRDACGFEPVPGSARLRSWLVENAHGFAPVLKPDPRTTPVRVFDFSAGSTEFHADHMMQPESAGPAIFAHMTDAGASTGIGRYDEARLIYSGSQYETDKPGDERRTVHIGLDLFQKAGSPVFAPIEGIVLFVRDNDEQNDYGPTLILRHEPRNGPVFFTLFGHLSRNQIEGIVEGAIVEKGGHIADIGTPQENGGWVPHLHFQIITDMLDFKGTYPGVVAPSERDVWLRLCPDPNLIVGIPEGAFPKREPAAAQILKARSEHIGPSLSISYSKPLHIVRGYMQHLFDVDGRRFLDAVNNVAHVGHSHPRVVDAGQKQMAALNTNTRYLHKNLVEYAERLTATMPESLSVVFFVNSGSEANDLALRLARNFTGARQRIVLEGAYHGDLSALVDISPYKYDGPGGSGAPATTLEVPMPDPYRGLHRGNGVGVGKTYAEYVRSAAEEAVVAGGLSALIAESVLGCGGQIVLPDGYLKGAFEHVRSAGGICIVDEVQVGMGRVGTHFWGFQTQNCVPDIVTIGKPIGNGHPLGAVVTTREIADAFANGMEYFNTFGGNPVSCAIGMAVLDVIEGEQLQEQALSVGSHLIERLRALAEKRSVIGDVRGLGLFIGVELVRDRDSLEPADDEATYVINRMREEGILMGTDGPLHNVLKINPPLVFGEEDADRLAELLDRILGEDFVTHRLRS